MFISLSRIEREQIEATARRGFTPEEQVIWNRSAAAERARQKAAELNVSVEAIKPEGQS